MKLNAIRAGVIGALVTGAALSAIAATDAKSRVPFPDGYLQWTHIKTGSGARGVHRIYANETALKARDAGKFLDGSILVFDVHTSKVNADKTTTEGARSAVDVMVKDSKRFPSTGGWAFEEFAGDDRQTGVVSETAAAACAKCHEGQKDNDLVFTVK